MSNELPRQFGPVYTLLKLLARGGMGEIYLARSTGITGFEKYYAVKKLLKKFANDNDVGTRFIDEAKLGARLQHPNIVQVFDLGRVNDEIYMATEFVDGFDLRRVLRFCHERKKRIPLDIALFIVREVLSGLAYAHRQLDAEGRSIDLIHRDISPQNVLVSFEGEVKIIDFGLAKSTQRSAETQANVLLGNFGYMSPEQARGQPLDVRTDVYSVGIVLFELCTGTKRFVEENPLRLLELVARPTPLMPSDRVNGVPNAIDRLYGRATAFAREERYASAEAFRDDVAAALHRLNTRASRENLAQFLNHLFLGGAAPPTVDAGILDKSVAIMVRDLHEQSEAFQRTAADDIKDRRLNDFSDDAPQTGSHAIMRAARVGDDLTHKELTGDDMPGPPASASGEAAPPAPASATSVAARRPDALDIPMVVLPHVDLPRVPPDVDSAIISVVGEALESSEGQPVAPAALDFVVEVTSGEGAAVSADTEPAIAAAVAPAAFGPVAATPAVAGPSVAVPAVAAPVAAIPVFAPPMAARSEDVLVVPPDERTQPGAPPPMPPPSPSGSRKRVPQASHGQAKVVTTIGPAPRRPESTAEQPSIVLANDLEPDEPTVVGAMPSPRARSGLPRDATDDGGFGPGNDSIIIEFGSELEAAPAAPPPPVVPLVTQEPAEVLPVAAPAAAPPMAIRPAATPLGRTVVATVAEPGRARAVEESTPGSRRPPVVTESNPPRKK